MQPEARSIDEKTKTIAISQPHFVLSNSSILPGYHHRVLATTIEIAEDIQNPGCDLILIAATITAPSDGVTLDVSGADQKGFAAKDRRDATGMKSGVDGGDGGDGDDGGDGLNGGRLTLDAARILGGALTLRSNGGKGGRGQDGGNGQDGGTVIDAADAPYPQQIQVGTQLVETTNNHYANVPVYDWGSDVTLLGQNGIGAFLSKAHEAQTGHRGGDGGNAGLAGKSGNGGNGGSVSYLSLATPARTIKMEAGGGKAGGKAQHGKPGNASAGGKGGRFRFMGGVGFIQIDWSFYEDDKRWAEHWTGSKHFRNLGVDPGHLVTDGSQPITRAPSGPEGKDGGFGAKGLATPPEIPNAADGRPGDTNELVVTFKTKPRRDLPLSYFFALQRSVSIAIANRDLELAGLILEWLLFLTSRTATLPETPTPEQQQAHAIYHSARQSLLTLGRDDADVQKANIYADINMYSAFVKGSIDLILRQEKHLKTFEDALRAKELERGSLRKAIKEAEVYQDHLKGSVSSVGSIAFLRSRENDLKMSIAALDVDVFNLRIRLEQMEAELESDINQKFHEQTKLTLSTVLDVTMMAVGIAMGVYNFGRSLATMVGTVKKFYEEAMQHSTWTEIMKDRIWNASFDELKADLGALMDKEEWKALTKGTKGLVKTTVDFQAKIEAYFKLMNSKQKLKIDKIDLQASVLTYDSAKLELRRQRLQLEKDLHKLLDEFDAALEWKLVFENFFHTSHSRFDNLAHLAEIQSARREAEFQLALSERNEEALRRQLDLRNFDPTSIEAGTSLESLRSSRALALDEGLMRVLDLGRAYRAWSLNDPNLPVIPQNLTADDLEQRFNAPLWKAIALELSADMRRSRQEFPVFTVPRTLYPPSKADFRKRCFDEGLGAWRFNFSVPIDSRGQIFHIALIDAKAVLRGLSVTKGSEIYCVLVHRGTSEFIDRNRASVRTLQVPRAIAYSYRIENGEPVFGYKGAVEAEFDDEKSRHRIRYSPYATWEVRIHPDHRLIDGGTVYNRGLDWSGFEGIELSFSAFFHDFSTLKLEKKGKRK